jgi:G3E family GTPase
MREKFVFQGVHMTFNGEPQSEWGPDEKRVNRMVFIGKNLDRKELVDNFEACIVHEDA